MKKPHNPFLLRLTSGSLPPLIVGILIIAILFGALTLIYEVEGILKLWANYKRSSYSVGALAYIVYISRIIQNAHNNYYGQLIENSPIEKEEKLLLKNQFENQRKLWLESFIAFFVGFGHAYFAILKDVFNGQSELPIYHIWVGSLIVLVWIIITQSISIYMRNMTVMNDLAKRLEVDLLNLDKLMPLTKAGIISILAFIGAYSILFATGIDLSDLTNPAIIALIPTIAIMLHRPLRKIPSIISKAKEKEVALIDEAINGNTEALKASRLRHNLQNINVIDLISYKKIIQNTMEIPVNIPTASRFVFYLVLPLLTWIAASLIDKVIDYIIK